MDALNEDNNNNNRGSSGSSKRPIYNQTVTIKYNSLKNVLLKQNKRKTHTNNEKKRNEKKIKTKHNR